MIAASRQLTDASTPLARGSRMAPYSNGGDRQRGETNRLRVLKRIYEMDENPATCAIWRVQCYLEERGATRRRPLLGCSPSAYTRFCGKDDVSRGFLTTLFAAKQTLKQEGNST